jgi:hypothetical protein
VDVLIVLDWVENYLREVERTSGLMSELSLRHGKSISCVYVGESKWREADTLFFLNVRGEAIPA